MKWICTAFIILLTAATAVSQMFLQAIKTLNENVHENEVEQWTNFLFQKNYRRMVPMLIMLLVVTVVSAFFDDFSSETIIYDAVVTVIDIYSIFTVYSLYCVNREKSDIECISNYVNSQNMAC